MGTQWANGTRLKDLDFADDISLLAETRDTLQEMTTSLEKEAGKIGLWILRPCVAIDSNINKKSWCSTSQMAEEYTGHLMERQDN